VTTNLGNQLYMFASILAHNVTRELQMISQPPQRVTSAKRPALWIFRELQTIRRQIIQRAGRLTHPHGRLTLTMAGNDAVRSDIEHFLAALDSDHPAAA